MTTTLPAISESLRRGAGSTIIDSSLATTTLEYFNAIKFVNEILWKPDVTHAKFRMFDSILVKSGEIINWLFESSEGLIKSKSRSRWNTNGVVERSFIADAEERKNPTSSSSANKLVLYSPDGKFWRPLNIDILDAYLTRTSNAENPPIVIVSAAHMEQNIGSSPAFIEQTFHPTAKKSGKNNLTSVLSNPAGTIEKPNQQHQAGKGNNHISEIPQHKVVCKNKEICQLCTAFIESLIRLIENRKPGCKIVSMTIVVVVENDGAYQNKLSIGEVPPARRLWLHHVRNIVFISPSCSSSSISSGNDEESTSPTSHAVDPTDPQSMKASAKRQSSNKNGADKDNWEKRSTTSSTVTLSNQNFTRPAKCNGDFCRYDELEEIRTMQVLATETKSSKLEITKAKQRHRRLTAGELAKTDQLIGNSLSAETAIAATLHAGNDEANDNESAITNDLDAEADRLGPLPVMSSAAHVISYKSIALARQEMGAIDSALKSSAINSENEIQLLCEAVPWSDRLVHWWLRVGKTVAGGRVGMVPTSAADKTCAAILSSNKGSSKHSSDVDTVNSGGNNSAVPYDLTDNSYAQNSTTHANKKAGTIATYYSDCTICERCFTAYKEIDTRRKTQTTGMFKAQREERDRRDIELGKSIERRIFAQRKTATRLAKVIAGRQKEPSLSTLGKRLDLDKGLNNMSVSDWNGSSIITDDFSDANNDLNGGSLLLSNQYMKVPAPISKSVLPPMPWQLSDHTNAAYVGQSGGAFIRNIGKKSEQVAAEVRQDKIIENYQNIYNRTNGIVGTVGSVDDQGSTGNNLDWTESWKKATGQHNPPQLHTVSAPSKRRKEAETVTSAFNAERLLHPYQRGMEKMRDDMRTEEEKQILAQRRGSGDVKIVLEKKAALKSVVIPKKTTELINNGVGVKMAKSESVPLHLQLMQERDRQMQELQMSSQPSSYDAKKPRSRQKMTSSVLDAMDSMGGIAFNSDGGSNLMLSAASLVGSPSSFQSLLTASPSKSLRKNVSFGKIDVNHFVDANMELGYSNHDNDYDDDNDGNEDSSLLAHTYSPKSMSSLPPKSKKASPKAGKARSPAGKHRRHDDDDGDDDEDGDDEAIGWSPFVIPTA
jgi:hypothetical protein